MKKVIYMGYSDIMLEKLLDLDYLNVILVVGTKGRINQKQYDIIEKNNVLYVEVSSSNDVNSMVFPDEDFFILMYKFEFIIPKWMIHKYVIINFHGGSIRYNRGAHATVWSILHCDKQTCLSMYKLTGGIDEGLLIDEYKINLTDEDDVITLNLKLVEGIPNLLKSLQLYLDGKIQPEMISGGIYYPKVQESDFTIRQYQDSIEDISAKVRSQKKYFGALLLNEGIRYRINNYEISQSSGKKKIILEKNKLIKDDGTKQIICILNKENC